MGEIRITSALFRGEQNLPDFGLKVGDSAPEGMWLSNARSGTETNRKAKISAAAVFLYRLLCKGAVNALYSTDHPAVYLEYHRDDTGNLYQGYYDDDTNVIFWNGQEPQQFDKLLPLILFSLHPESSFPETKRAFQACISNYTTTGRLNEGEIYKFCDDFYYEFKNRYTTAAFFMDDTLNLDMIRQGIRTGQMLPFTAFGELELPDLDVAQGVVMPTVEEEEATYDVDFGKCRSGAYVIDNVWELGDEKYIPPLSTLDKFVPTPSFYTMVSLLTSEIKEIMQRKKDGLTGSALIGENYINIILVGKPGTGKTTIAYALASALGMPIRTVAISKNSEEDTYEGKTKVVGGKFDFVPTPFLEAYKNGGIVVMEEFNLSDPGTIMGSIGQAIEAPFILYEDGHKQVQRNPFTIFISTMNTAAQGSREPSEALTSRSPFVFVIDDPSDEDFIKILQKKGYPEANCRRVFSAYKRILETLLSAERNEEEIAYSLGTRTCIGALKLMKIGCPFKDAINNTMVGTIAIKNLRLAREISDEVVDILPAA